MTNYYKLTTADYKSVRGDCLWGSGVSRRVALPLIACRNGIHIYTDPLVGLCLNPVHANIETPIVWRGRASGEVLICPDKIVAEEFTTLEIEQVEPPSLMQRVAFGVLCARKVYRSLVFTRWAERWLLKDKIYRSAVMAREVERETVVAARAVGGDLDMAWAAWAAWAAARAAGVVREVMTASEAAWAAWAASVPVQMAVQASRVSLDLPALIRQAMIVA